MTCGRKSVVLLLLIALAPARARAADEPEGTITQQERQERLAYIRKLLGEFTFETDRDPPMPLTLAEEPALTYTNPVRSKQAGGATYFWLRDGRPMAATTVSIRDQGQVFREFTALGDEPLVARYQAQVDWSPRKNGKSFAPLEGAPEPAATSALRLAQMRRLSGRFRLRVLRANPIDARLLTQPLYRYSDPRPGTQNGAVFAFVEATDPEAFLVLEVRPDDAHPSGRWYFSLAKMTAPPVEIYLDDRLIWSVSGYWRNPRSRDDSYMESPIGVYREGSR